MDEKKSELLEVIQDSKKLWSELRRLLFRVLVFWGSILGMVIEICTYWQCTFPTKNINGYNVGISSPFHQLIVYQDIPTVHSPTS